MRVGFPELSMAAMMGVMVGVGVTGLAVTSEPVMDVTSMRVVGQGCGDARQQERIFVAREESDLPGPKCDVVFELADRDFR